MIDYKLEHICSYVVRGGDRPPEVIGPAPEGVRVNFYSGPGEVTGPRVRGTMRPVGGDWMTVRRDGVGIVDARTTLETSDGALILITYGGVVDLGPEGYEQFLRGQLPPTVRLLTAPRFSTGHSDYLWLNRLQCVGVGEYQTAAREVRYDVHAIR